MSLADAFSTGIVRGGTVLVPVGSLEQHGAHLPLDTDTVVATAVAERLAPLVGATVAPPVAYGASGEHQSFAGTVSIGTEVLTEVLVELVRSLSTWAARTVLVNGHGGNLAAVRTALRRLQHEGHDVDWVPCATPGADLHAGRTETSVMLHLAPHRVRLAAARPGNRAALEELLPAMRTGGLAAVTRNGVLGDPRAASAAEGAAVLDDMVGRAYGRLASAVRA